jgi:predicted PurR-regulated permease PerM
MSFLAIAKRKRMPYQVETTFSRRLFMTLFVVVASLLVWYTLHMLLLIFLGVIFGIFLIKTGELISEQTGLRNAWSMGIVLLGILLISSAAVVVMAPKIAGQVRELADQLPNSWQNIQQSVSRNDFGGWVIQHLPPMERIIGSLGGLMQRATAWLYSFLGAFTGILIIIVLGLYLAFGADIYIQGIVKLVPKEKRGRARRILHGLGATLYWWLIGRLISMLIIGIFTFIGLWWLGVPLAFTLGFFAAVMTFIPNLGPIISVIPAILMALQNGWAQAGYVIILYTALQTVESYLITPLVQRRVIAMPPALILSAQIILGVIQGVLGILVATPLVATIIVLTKFMYIEGVLDDHAIEIEAENPKS